MTPHFIAYDRYFNKGWIVFDVRGVMIRSFPTLEDARKYYPDIPTSDDLYDSV